MGAGRAWERGDRGGVGWGSGDGFCVCTKGGLSRKKQN